MTVLHTAFLIRLPFLLSKLAIYLALSLGARACAHISTSGLFELQMFQLRLAAALQLPE